MADTRRGDFPGVKCSDCGGEDVCLKHWGRCVPFGTEGYFDEDCFIERRKHVNSGQKPLPLGYKLVKADTNSKKMVTPKFLTQEIAGCAVELVLTMVMDPHMRFLKRNMCHIVILVPSMKDDREANYPNWPNYSLEPHALYERSVAKKEWPHKFDEIARCKALQLWYGRNDTRTDIRPQLLFPGDTPYWGGVKRHGIVVSCSGVQPWFDKMISGMIADMCVGLAYNAWMLSEDRSSGADFLS